MKTMKKLILLAVVLLASAATSYAQLSAIAQITANIQSPSSISSVLDLNFGNIFTPISIVPRDSLGAATGTPSTAVSGSVTIPSKSGPDRFPTNGIQLGTGVGQAAKFVITGTPDTWVLMSLPTFTPITLFSGIDFMNVTLDYSGLGSSSLASGDKVLVPLDGGGSFTFYVGGTLFIAANQAWGSYANDTDLEFVINQ